MAPRKSPGIGWAAATLAAAAALTASTAAVRSGPGVKWHPSSVAQEPGIVFADLSAPGETDLFVADASGRMRRQLTSTAGLDEGAPAASPRDAVIALEGTAPGPEGTPFTTVFVLGASGASRQLSGGPADTEPSWHPGGDALVYATRFGQVSAIVRTGTGSLQEQPLAQMDSAAHALAQPAYGPDGSRLAIVVRSVADGGELWVVDGAGGGARRLLRHPGWDDVNPAWSPDGKRVAFASGPWEGAATRHDLWRLDLASGIAGTLVTDREYDLNRPAWSPDGAAVVYERRLPGARQAGLFRIAAAGGDPVFLTSGESPNWWTARIVATSTAGPTAPGATATAPIPTEGPPFPSLPPPPATAPAFPTPGPVEPTSTGPAPTFPPPTPTATPTRPTATVTRPSDRHAVFLPALPAGEPDPTPTPTTVPTAAPATAPATAPSPHSDPRTRPGQPQRSRTPWST